MNKKLFILCAFALYLMGCSHPETEKDSNIQAFNQMMKAVDGESLKLHALVEQLKAPISATEKNQILCREIPHQYDVIESLLQKNRHIVLTEHLSLVDYFLLRLDAQRLTFKNSHHC